LPSLHCGFYEVFSDKTKIIFSGYAMIDEDDFGFVTKDFVKPTAEGRQFITPHPQKRQKNNELNKK